MQDGPTTGDTEITIKIDNPAPKFVKVAESSAAYYGVTADGQLYAWGQDNSGATGTDKTCHTSKTYTDAEMLARFIDDYGYNPTNLTETSEYYNVTLANDWGYTVWDEPITTAEQGALAYWAAQYEGSGTTNAADTTTYIQYYYGYNDIQEMIDDSYGTTESNPLKWLYLISYGTTNIVHTSTVCGVPTLVNGHGDLPADAQVVEVYTGGNSDTVFAIDANDNVYGWGFNSNGGVGVGDIGLNIFSPTKLTFPAGAGKIVEISVGSGFAVARDENGQVYGWGMNFHGQVGIGTTSGAVWTPTAIATDAQTGQPLVATKVYAARTIVFATDASGTLYGWGDGTNKKLPAGSSSRPVDQISQSTCSGSGDISSYRPKFVDFTSAGVMGFALDTTGEVWVWGAQPNSYGTAGVGAIATNFSCPQNVSRYADGYSWAGRDNSAIWHKKIVKLVGANNTNDSPSMWAQDEDGDWYMWGVGFTYTWTGVNGSKLWPVAVDFAGTDLDGVEIKNLATGSSILAVGDDDAIYAWGYDYTQTMYSSLQTTPKRLSWPAAKYTSVILDAAGTPAECRNVVVVSQDADGAVLKCTTSAHVAGTVSVTVNYRAWWGNAATLADSFTYVPVVPGVPNSGALGR